MTSSYASAKRKFVGFAQEVSRVSVRCILVLEDLYHT
jgi:hypothetical protein